MESFMSNYPYFSWTVLAKNFAVVESGLKAEVSGTLSRIRLVYSLNVYIYLRQGFSKI